MPWASTTEYNDAIQNLRTSVSDEELRAGELARTPQGIPLLWSGNFADVYRVHCEQTGSTWAVKCFTRESPGLRERYRQISDHLERACLRFMVDFEFVEPGILVGGQWHPFLKMRWVEGLALDEFVEQYLDRPATLRQLLGLWVKLAARLEEAQMAHADLQHGNVILVPLPEGRLALRLIDYDGMYVPTLAGRRSGELGHPAYQHPQRLRQGIYSLEVDRFSHLVIFCSIRCLMVGRRDLWRFHTGENLLFRERDFARPERSQVFRELWALPDADARSLVGRLFLAAQRPLGETPLLGDLLSNGSAVPLSGEEERKVDSALGGGAVGAKPSGVSAPEQVVSDEKRPWWETGLSPLPEASAGGEIGTVPDVRSGTQPTLVTTARQYGAKALALGARLVRGALHAPVAVFRWGDAVLRAVAGGENVILHNFLRVLALVALVLVAFVSVRMGPEWIENAMALIPERSAPPAEPYEVGQKEVPVTFTEEIRVDLGAGVTMEMVRIPAGEFLMGSPDSDRDAQSDERPQHEVRISEPFYLGKYEVTQQQWEAVMRDNPSRFKGPKNPVEQVSWDDCQAFLRKLNEEQTGNGGTFRLPTEAEWEYACRAGSSTRWCFGDDEASLGEYAWYTANFGRWTHPVGEKTPNAWGLYDVHGNVWEWCADWYDSAYYRSSPSNDPRGPSSGRYRVLRGGCWVVNAGLTRSARRGGSTPLVRLQANGLRVARTCGDGPSTAPVPQATEPLRITPIPPQTVEVGRPLTVAVSVENAEYWEGKVRYNLAPESPNGAEIDEVTGVFSWTPTQEERPGTDEVTVLATGPDGQADEHTFLVTVTSANEITVDLGGGVGMEMVLIAAGEFWMGSPDSDDEKPQHRVRITQPFYLGKYEVTQEQWEAVMGDNPSRFKSPKNPVEQVRWNDCQEFLRRLNAKSRSAGGTFCLPTEAEWEYACRAGSTTRWCFGDQEGTVGDYAWYSANSARSAHPVGQKRPNAWGLYDVHGNVWEWCADWYEGEYYGSAPSNDPKGPNSGRYRVRRGGSWSDLAWTTRSPYRRGNSPDYRTLLTGFRVARTP